MGAGAWPVDEVGVGFLVGLGVGRGVRVGCGVRVGSAVGSVVGSLVGSTTGAVVGEGIGSTAASVPIGTISSWTPPLGVGTSGSGCPSGVGSKPSVRDSHRATALATQTTASWVLASSPASA